VNARIRHGLAVLAAAWTGLSPAGAQAPSAPPSPGDAAWAVLLERGREALHDELYDLAESLFREAAARAPSDEVRADCAAGVIGARVGRGQPREALAYLAAEVPASAAGRPAAILARALAQRAAGDVAGAMECLATLSAAGVPPDLRERAWRLLALVLDESRRTDEALAVWDALVREFPASPRHALDRAELRARVDPGPAAVAAVEDLVRTHPSSPEALTARLMLARLRVLAGDAEAALTVARPIASDTNAPPADRARAWLVLGAVEEARTNLAAAAAALDRGRELAVRTPAAADVAFHRAGLGVRSGDLDAGRDRLREAIQAYPRHPEGARIQMDLARRLLDAGRHADALAGFQNHLDAYEDPAGRAEAQMGKGWCLLELQRHAEAAAAFEKAAEQLADPLRRAEAEFKAADAWFANGQFPTAFDRYAAFGSAHPAHPLAPRAAFLAAESLYRSGRADEALARFAAIEARSPDSPLAPQAALQRVRILEARGAWDDALAGHEAILARHPAAPEAGAARLGRGLIRYRRGEFEAALKDFDALASAGDAGPVPEHAAFMRGWCLYLLGRDEDSVRVCREFIARHPASAWAPDVQFWLGEHAYNLGDHVTAEAEFLRVAEAHAASPLADQALYRAGRSAAAAHEFVRAIEHYSRLATTYPKSPYLPDARFAQGDALSELGRFDAALLLFDGLIKARPDSYLALLAWGRKGDCHFTLGGSDVARYAQALSSYQAVRDNPRASADLAMQADYKAGRCLERMGRPGEAFDRYMAVVYSHAAERRAGRTGAPVWFVRAAFGAAAIEERGERWREAANIYQRVVDDGGSAAADAAARIRKIRAEHWMLF